MKTKKKLCLLTVLLLSLFALSACHYLAEKQAFTPQALKGFFASAFSNEYGDVDKRPMLRWEKDLTITLQGNYTQEDFFHLSAFLDLLREEVPALPGLFLLDSKSPQQPNVTIHFVPKKDMPALLPGYVAPNRGFFTYRYQDYLIYEATVAIDSLAAPQEKNAIVEEELLNLLGLCNDIDFLPESILYTGFPKPLTAAPIDFEMLCILYHPSLNPGMREKEAYQALGGVK